MIGPGRKCRGYGGWRRLCELPHIAPVAALLILLAATVPALATAKDSVGDHVSDNATRARLKLIISLSPVVTSADRAAARTLFHDAYSRLQADAPAEAVRLFERGLVLNPGAPLANLWLAESYRRQGSARYASDQMALAEAIAAMTDNAKIAEMQSELPEVNPWAAARVDQEAPDSITSGQFLRLWRGRAQTLE